jgi:hypothetical protein
MKNEKLSESDYDITSDYETTEEESIVLRVNKTNNLLNSNLIDYSKLKCHSCQSDSNNINFVIITLLFLIFVITYYFLKKKN